MPAKHAHTKAIVSQTPDDVGSPQVHFDGKSFNDFITDKGYDCYIERAMRCPCMDSNVGQPLPDCFNCMGTGWFYIQKQESRIICTNMSNRNRLEPWSATNMGTVSISTRPVDKLGFMDRVTLLELEMWYSETLKLRRSDDNTTIFAFTKYFPVTVFNCYLFIDSNTPLLPITPDLYTVTNNKIVFDFSTFSLMPLNSMATIRYTNYPMYHILDVNRDLIKTLAGKNCSTLAVQRQNLPLNYVGRIAHYVLDQPNLAGDSVFDNTVYT